MRKCYFTLMESLKNRGERQFVTCDKMELKKSSTANKEEKLQNEKTIN